MNVTTMDMNAIEGMLIARNEQASAVGTAFEMVQSTITTVMCSDCCGSNGNSCDPRDQY